MRDAFYSDESYCVLYYLWTGMYMPVCVYACVLAAAYERAVRVPIARVTGSCEPSNAGAENKTPALHTSSAH